jgi:predicted DNA-binding protein YlxM (UPF0122 family)
MAFLKGEGHPKAKLTEHQVLKIRQLFDNGFSVRVIAKNFRVSNWNVKSIVSKKTWSHL